MAVADLLKEDPMFKLVSRIPVVLPFLLAPTLFGGPNKVPARLTQARYIALAYDLGDVMLSEAEAVSKPARVLPEDREALNGVRDLIEKWGRYVITIRPAGGAAHRGSDGPARFRGSGRAHRRAPSRNHPSGICGDGRLVRARGLLDGRHAVGLRRLGRGGRGATLARAAAGRVLRLCADPFRRLQGGRGESGQASLTTRSDGEHASPTPPRA